METLQPSVENSPLAFGDGAETLFQAFADSRVKRVGGNRGSVETSNSLADKINTIESILWQIGAKLTAAFMLTGI